MYSQNVTILSCLPWGYLCFTCSAVPRNGFNAEKSRIKGVFILQVYIVTSAAACAKKSFFAEIEISYCIGGSFLLLISASLVRGLQRVCFQIKGCTEPEAWIEANDLSPETKAVSEPRGAAMRIEMKAMDGPIYRLKCVAVTRFTIRYVQSLELDRILGFSNNY